MNFKPFKKIFRIETPKPKKEKITTKEKNLEEITVFSNNPKKLLEKLDLKKIKAIKNKENIETEIINSSGIASDLIILKRKRFLEIAKNQEEYKKYPLVDLGSNGNTSLIELAHILELDGLVLSDIEKHINPEYIDRDEKLAILDLDIDMLELLQQLPDNSANISMFAIDNIVINNKEYREKIKNEIMRILPKEGLLITRQSILEDDENFMEKFDSVGKSKMVYQFKNQEIR